MERGLYAAATGMMAQQTIQDILAQNLANSATVGYKQDVPTFKALHAQAIQRVDGSGHRVSVGQVSTGVAPDKVYTDWQTGPLSNTGAGLDASLEQGQFFTVQTQNGIRYTRAGNFQLNGTGALVTNQGQPVLGVDGQPIRIAGSTPPRIEANGDVTVSGRAVARLQVVTAGKDALAKDGDTLFRVVDPASVKPALRPELHPGTLEQSNVSVVSGIVKMISVSRAFDMAQRAITTQDDMLKHAANDLGRV